jgi:hypothetical protein
MRAAGWALAGVLLCTYAWFHHDGGFNQNSRFDLTRALVERHTIRIDAYHGNTLDKAVRDGHVYCDKPPGVSLLGVPPYAAAFALERAAGADPDAPRPLAWAAWATRVVAVSTFGALLPLLLLVLVGPRCAPRHALVLAAGLGLGTLAFPYSTVFYGHVVAAWCVFAAFALAYGVRHRGLAPGPALGLAGLAAGAAIVTEYECALLVALLGLYLLAAPATRRGVAAFVLGAAPPLAGLAVYHTVAFGAPWSTGFVHEALPHWQRRYGEGLYGLRTPDPQALWGLTLGARRGLFRQAPWLLLALPGLWALARTRDHRAEAALVAAAFVVMLGLNAALHSWEGGWTMGARYLIPVVPLLAFAAAFAAGRAARVAAAVLVPVSAFFMLAGAAVMPEVPIFVLRPLRDFLLPWFLSGRLSVPNPDANAFNLGEALGLHGLWSLAPLLVLWAAGAALVVRLAPPGAAAVTTSPRAPSAPAAPPRSDDAA